MLLLLIISATCNVFLAGLWALSFRWSLSNHAVNVIRASDFKAGDDVECLPIAVLNRISGGSEGWEVVNAETGNRIEFTGPVAVQRQMAINPSTGMANVVIACKDVPVVEQSREPCLS